MIPVTIDLTPLRPTTLRLVVWFRVERANDIFCAMIVLTLAVAMQLVAITHVTVVDVERAASRSDLTVVVNGQRIAAVGPAASAKIPIGAHVIDGRGKWLIPGLWDMHVHTRRPDGTAAAQPLCSQWRHRRARHGWRLRISLMAGGALSPPARSLDHGSSLRVRISRATARRSPTSRSTRQTTHAALSTRSRCSASTS